MIEDQNIERKLKEKNKFDPNLSLHTVKWSVQTPEGPKWRDLDQGVVTPLDLKVERLSMFLNTGPAIESLLRNNHVSELLCESIGDNLKFGKADFLREKGKICIDICFYSVHVYVDDHISEARKREKFVKAICEAMTICAKEVIHDSIDRKDLIVIGRLMNKFGYEAEEMPSSAQDNILFICENDDIRYFPLLFDDI